MKILPLCCVLASLLSVVSAENKDAAVSPSLPDSSLLNKEELKKLPRLGMTMNQLKSLWGNPLGGSEGAFEWDDVGGIHLRTFFSPLYSTTDQVFLKPDTSRCRSIAFMYVDQQAGLGLNDEEALKIAQALLPGFTWKCMILPEQKAAAAAREDASKPSSDPFASEPVPESILIYSTTDHGKTYELRRGLREGYEYELKFREDPKLIQINTNQL